MSRFEVLQVRLFQQQTFKVGEGGQVEQYSHALAFVQVRQTQTGNIRTTVEGGQSVKEAVCRAVASVVDFDVTLIQNVLGDGSTRERVWVNDTPYWGEGPQPFAWAQAVLKAAEATAPAQTVENVYVSEGRVTEIGSPT